MTVDHAGQQMLDPRIRHVWMVASAVPGIALLVIAPLLAIAGLDVVPFALAAVAVLELVAAALLPEARWRSWSYQLTSTELIIRFGVVVKVERWLPRTRIQHVDIVGGPIERWLGLRQIVIYTAGTREADVTVPGLRTGDAELLRAELLSWVADTAPEDVPSPEDDAHATDTPDVLVVDGAEDGSFDGPHPGEP